MAAVGTTVASALLAPLARSSVYRIGGEATDISSTPGLGRLPFTSDHSIRAARAS